MSPTDDRTGERTGEDDERVERDTPTAEAIAAAARDVWRGELLTRMSALEGRADRSSSAVEELTRELETRRRADGDLAELIGGLAAGIEQIRTAQIHVLDGVSLLEVRMDRLAGAQRETDDDVRRARLRIQELSKRTQAGAYESIRVPLAKAEVELEHLRRTTAKIEGELEDTKKRDMRSIVEAAQRANDDKARALEEARASQHEIQLEKRKTWTQTYGALLSILVLAAGALITSIAASRCGAPAHPSPPPTAAPTQEPHP